MTWRTACIAAVVLGMFGLAALDFRHGAYRTGTISLLFGVANILIFWSRA